MISRFFTFGRNLARRRVFYPESKKAAMKGATVLAVLVAAALATSRCKSHFFVAQCSAINRLAFCGPFDFPFFRTHFVVTLAILIKLSAITPNPTHLSIPRLPLYRQRNRPCLRLSTLIRPSDPTRHCCARRNQRCL